MADEWINWLSKLHVVRDGTSVKDFADKLNSTVTIFFYVIIIVIVTTKEYVFSTIDCYFSVLPSGDGAAGFLTNYCFVTRTIAVLPGEALPTTNEAWRKAEEEKGIQYYQWIPLVLALQCICYYLPSLIWDAFLYNRCGLDMPSIISSAYGAQNVSGEKRQDKVAEIAETLEDLFYKHRSYSRGKWAQKQRQIFRTCNFCIPSKRAGNQMMVGYMFIKIIYIINAILQIVFIQHLLQFKGNIGFGWDLLKNLWRDNDWVKTRYFPRVTFCHYAGLRALGATNTYNGQCTLPNNMLYEKIYIFLWVWTLLVAAFTIISMPMWYLRLGIQSNRTHLIKKCLKVADCYDGTSNYDRLKTFESTFLRLDGVFLLSMINRNAGEMVGTDITAKLWDIFCKKYENKEDLRRFELKSSGHNGHLTTSPPPFRENDQHLSKSLLDNDAEPIDSGKVSPASSEVQSPDGETKSVEV